MRLDFILEVSGFELLSVTNLWYFSLQRSNSRKNKENSSYGAAKRTSSGSTISVAVEANGGSCLLQTTDPSNDQPTQNVSGHTPFKPRI